MHPIANILIPFIYKYYYYVSDKSFKNVEDDEFYYIMLNYMLKSYNYQEFIINYFPN